MPIHEYILISNALDVEAVGSEDIPPSTPTIIGRPSLLARASSSEVVKGGGAVPLPVVLIWVLFLFATGNQHDIKGPILHPAQVT